MLCGYKNGIVSLRNVKQGISVYTVQRKELVSVSITTKPSSSYVYGKRTVMVPVIRKWVSLLRKTGTMTVLFL